MPYLCGLQCGTNTSSSCSKLTTIIASMCLLKLRCTLFTFTNSERNTRHFEVISSWTKTEEGINSASIQTLHTHTYLNHTHRSYLFYYMPPDPPIWFTVVWVCTSRYGSINNTVMQQDLLTFGHPALQKKTSLTRLAKIYCLAIWTTKIRLRRQFTRFHYEGILARIRPLHFCNCKCTAL